MTCNCGAPYVGWGPAKKSGAPQLPTGPRCGAPGGASQVIPRPEANTNYPPTAPAPSPTPIPATASVTAPCPILATHSLLLTPSPQVPHPPNCFDHHPCPTISTNTRPNPAPAPSPTPAASTSQPAERPTLEPKKKGEKLENVNTQGDHDTKDAELLFQRSHCHKIIVLVVPVIKIEGEKQRGWGKRKGWGRRRGWGTRSGQEEDEDEKREEGGRE